MFFNIFKITIFSLGIVLILHLLLKIVASQNEDNILKPKRYKIKTTPNDNIQKNTRVDVLPEESIETNLDDMKNELSNWMQTQCPEILPVRDEEVEKIFKEQINDVKNVGTIVEKPKLSEITFKIDDTKNFEAATYAQTPMNQDSWKYAFETLDNNQQNVTSDSLSAFESGSTYAAYNA